MSNTKVEEGSELLSLFFFLSVGELKDGHLLNVKSETFILDVAD